MQTIRLIVNPVSGKGRSLIIAEQAKRELQDHGLTIDVAYSRSAADVTILTQAAVHENCPIVIGVGGDGLIHQIGNVLVDTNTALGIIPAGVGNDIARGMGIPLYVEDACAIIAQRHMRPVDVAQINDRYFFSVAVIGFAAEVNRRANRFHRLRVSALYTALTVASALTDRPLSFTITYDGQERRCYSWLIAVGNTWSCGRGMMLVPGARWDDGMLDACIVNGMGRLELLSVFPRVFRGTHAYHTSTDMVHGREISVAADSPCEAYADGERIASLPVVFRAVPRALTVMLPKEPALQ
jgi:diacylglycerol kinase (ATP)